MPTLSSTFIRFVSDEFDLTANGDHEVGTSFSTGQLFHPIGAQVVVTDRAGTLVTPALVSIGGNSPNFNDIVTVKTVGGVLDGIADLAVNNDVHRLAYGTVIKAKVVAAIGVGLTLKAKAILYGFYQ